MVEHTNSTNWRSALMRRRPDDARDTRTSAGEDRSGSQRLEKATGRWNLASNSALGEVRGGRRRIQKPRDWRLATHQQVQ